MSRGDHSGYAEENTVLQESCSINILCSDIVKGRTKFLPPSTHCLRRLYKSFGLTARRVLKAYGGKGIMARRWGLSYNDILACLDVLSDVDSEHEVDIEDSLSWDESDPESEKVSDSYIEIC